MSLLLLLAAPALMTLTLALDTFERRALGGQPESWLRPHTPPQAHQRG